MQNSVIKNWYVLYTKPRWERKIADRLTSLGIECYCPLNRVDRKWSDRWKTVFEPLFRCYVFVKVQQEETVKPLEINGVLNYIYHMKQPARVRDCEIDDIKRFLTEYQSVKLEKITVDVNDNVEVLYGPLMDKKGLVTQVHENFVKVAISSLGYSLVATVSKSGIRKLENMFVE